jgi:hypothetical protein
MFPLVSRKSMIHFVALLWLGFSHLVLAQVCGGVAGVYSFLELCSSRVGRPGGGEHLLQSH